MVYLAVPHRSAAPTAELECQLRGRVVVLCREPNRHCDHLRRSRSITWCQTPPCSAARSSRATARASGARSHTDLLACGRVMRSSRADAPCGSLTRTPLAGRQPHVRPRSSAAVLDDRRQVHLCDLDTAGGVAPGLVPTDGTAPAAAERQGSLRTSWPRWPTISRASRASVLSTYTVDGGGAAALTTARRPRETWMRPSALSRAMAR